MDEVWHLLFVFVPDGAEVPASWRAAHPEAVSVPARLKIEWSTPHHERPVVGRPKLAQWWMPLLSRPPGVLPRLMERISGQSGKEAASNVPSWAKGVPRRVGETPRDYAKRILDDKYGPGRWEGTGPKSEYNIIKKFGQRAFRDPAEWLIIVPDLGEPI